MSLPTNSQQGASSPLAWRSGNHAENRASFSSNSSSSSFYQGTGAHYSPGYTAHFDLNGSPNGFPRRHSNASHAIQHVRNASGRTSFGSSFNSSIPPIPAEAEPSSMAWISIETAAQEMAFRQGQRDSAYSSDRIPPSPFEPRYDAVWEKYYLRGKVEGGEPVSAPKAGTAPANSGYEWAPLVNPWTQDLEQPAGSVDHGWTRKMCEIALSSMEGLIAKVCRRTGDWDKTVCAVPRPVEATLEAYPDLLQRYQELLQDAHEAKNGGLPAGYSQRHDLT